MTDPLTIFKSAFISIYPELSEAEWGMPYLEQLSVPAIALKGKDDYVPSPKNMETIMVEGKHTSPLEQPEQVMELIRRLIDTSAR